MTATMSYHPLLTQRRRAVMLVAVMAALASVPANGDGAPAAVDQLTAVLQCAAFAASAKTDTLDVEGARLATYAFSISTKTFDAARTIPPDRLDPFARVLQSKGGPAFYLGMEFAGAMAVVTNVLLEDVPPNSYPGDVPAEIKAQQASAATEFGKRNCTLIGR
jgi:hypothetical protein